MKLFGYEINITKPEKEEKLPLGFTKSKWDLEIDLSKVCDDHYDSKCTSGRCMVCSFDAVTYNPDRRRWFPKKDTYSRVCKVCEDLLGIPDSVTLSEATTKEDLWMDSLDEVELLMAVEEEFDIDIFDDQWEKCQNIGDVVSLVKGLV